MTICKVQGEQAEAVLEALRKNDFYCPCKLEHIPENKCMCKEFLEQQTEGPCHCGLYIKTEI